MRKTADGAIFEFVARVHAAVGSIDWSVLFFALLASLVGTVLSLVAGGVGLALFFLLSSLFLFLALWTKGLG